MALKRESQGIDEQGSVDRQRDRPDPGADRDTVMPLAKASATASKMIFAVSLFGSTLAAVVPTFVIPQFANVFTDFGAELPLLTRLAVEHTYVFWAIPILTLLIWWGWPDRAKGRLIALVFSWGTMLCLIPLLIVALYLPIFRMGQAIG